MRDLYNNIKVTGVNNDTASNDTAVVSGIVDRQGYDSLTFVILAGSLADADATFTVLVEDGDAANLSDAAAVADAYLLGTEANASFTFAADDTGKKIGYVGPKRYARCTITPASNTGTYVIGVCGILSHAQSAPVS